MSYDVDDSHCELELTKRLGNRRDTKGLILKLSGATPGDNGHSSPFQFRFAIQAIAETGVQLSDFPNIEIHNMPLAINQTSDSVTETRSFLYGIEHKGGLIVMESKKTKGVDLPYALTVAHYYATSAGINDFTKTVTDFGLSVVVKIRASDGKLDLTVDGPEQHPACALLYMFNEVNRTGKWKPTMCPHCSSIRRGRRMSVQSDSDEDSDSVPRRGSRQNASIANGGAFNGNANGNFIDRNYMIFRGRS